jgi:carboxyl-terminal processing protease
MRGEVDTAVTITVTRGAQELTFTMKRKPVVPDTVWTRDLGDGIYAIVIETFSRNDMAFEIYDQIKAVAPKARGFVFDVRNNPGGIVDEAIEAVSWYLHDGVIFSQRERVEGDPANPQYHKITWTRSGNRVIKEVVDEKSGKVLESGEVSFSQTDPVTGEQKLPFKDLPFIGDKPAVVLANEHSASAAEIFTGALSENRIAAPASGTASKDQPQGAIFIGVHTYGKFIGQAVMPGPLKTSVKATTFRYFTPRGEWLGDAWKVKIGLKADIEVKMPDNGVPYTATDAQLNAAKAYLLGNGTAGAAVSNAPPAVKP